MRIRGLDRNIEELPCAFITMDALDGFKTSSLSWKRKIGIILAINEAGNEKQGIEQIDGGLTDFESSMYSSKEASTATTITYIVQYPHQLKCFSIFDSEL